jgi:hypothetical protein
LILPYCIAADLNISAPATGVRDRPVQELNQEGLRCFYSVFESQPESFNQKDALQFHSTVESLFRQSAVIPFRFPTTLELLEELRQFLEEKSEPYRAALERLRTAVQMELRIKLRNEPDSSKASGTQYMQARLAGKRALESAAAAAQKTAGELCLDWQQREAADGLRWFALIERERISDFLSRIESLAVADEVVMFAGGPWPATEFIE